jgi:hypothetical protein
MVRRSILLAALAMLIALPARADQHEWKQLFNGKDLTGWKHVGPGSFVVQDGALKTQGGMGLLFYEGRKFGDCVIRVVWKIETPTSNGGTFIRIPVKPREEWMPVHYGYEVQVDNSNDDWHYTGVLYSLTKAMAKPAKGPGEWNTTEITLDGDRTIVHVNGVKVTDYVEGQDVPERTKDYEPARGRRPDYGYIGLQNHSDKDIVYYKEVSFKSLEK